MAFSQTVGVPIFPEAKDRDAVPFQKLHLLFSQLHKTWFADRSGTAGTYALNRFKSLWCLFKNRPGGLKMFDQPAGSNGTYVLSHGQCDAIQQFGTVDGIHISIYMLMISALVYRK